MQIKLLIRKFVVLQPVYLKAGLLENSGIIKCCLHAPFEYLSVTCQCCRSFASVTINVTDMCDYLVNNRKSFRDSPVDSRFLHEPVTKEMLSHEPYTPESTDSHSPNTEKIDSEEGEDRRDSVSPLQLKTRLENIIHTSMSTATFIEKSGSEDGVSAPRDDFCRQTLSETVRNATNANLVSCSNITSTVRLLSHHSSSDEEWFEFDENSNSRHSKQEYLVKEESFADSVIEVCDAEIIQDKKNEIFIKKTRKSTQECWCCIL